MALVARRQAAMAATGSARASPPALLLATWLLVLATRWTVPGVRCELVTAPSAEALAWGKLSVYQVMIDRFWPGPGSAVSAEQPCRNFDKCVG